ncbi:uncharacterized protein LOC106173197 isoform X2 [Lingula anatina]|uniref:Uncharacterized protein LOC106173197 isoform X2 n=1 Tax=Lingula anatina TaxID=7574 RepID=A0A1S3JHT4_LINAN|nr:uncharacterized protein LOC106173197 isoform X2 [Lingula anatina]|eukprot:XP_013409696.1 uncharacterized protein LOC106173197 isoform X2 [Lingula anatina]
MPTPYELECDVGSHTQDPPRIEGGMPPKLIPRAEPVPLPEGLISDPTGGQNLLAVKVAVKGLGGGDSQNENPSEAMETGIQDGGLGTQADQSEGLAPNNIQSHNRPCGFPVTPQAPDFTAFSEDTSVVAPADVKSTKAQFTEDEELEPKKKMVMLAVNEPVGQDLSAEAKIVMQDVCEATMEENGSQIAEELGINLVTNENQEDMASVADTLSVGVVGCLGQLEGGVESMSIQEASGVVSQGEELAQEPVTVSLQMTEDAVQDNQHQVSADESQGEPEARQASKAVRPQFLKMQSIPYTATTESTQITETPIRPSIQEGTEAQECVEQMGQGYYESIIKKMEELVNDAEKRRGLSREVLQQLKRRADNISKHLSGRYLDEFLLKESHKLDLILKKLSQSLELTESDSKWLFDIEDLMEEDVASREEDGDKLEPTGTKHSVNSLYSGCEGPAQSLPPVKQPKLHEGDSVGFDPPLGYIAPTVDRPQQQCVQATDDSPYPKFIKEEVYSRSLRGTQPWVFESEVANNPQSPVNSLVSRKVVFSTAEGLCQYMHDLDPCHVTSGTTGAIVFEKIAQEVEDSFDEGVHYEHVKVLGKGSYGRVSLCCTLSDKKRTEFVKKEVLNKAKFRGSEVVVPLQILHKNIPQVYGFINTPENYYILQEYSGCNLTQFLLSNEMDEIEIKEVTAQLLDVVAYLHSFNIYHRDIKADNIGVRPGLDGYGLRIKLLDFGACITPQDSPDLLGLTAAHCSPELCTVLVKVYLCKQACEDLLCQIDWVKADTYAVGCTVLHMYKKKHIFYEKMKSFPEEEKTKELLKYVSEYPRACLQEIPDVCVGEMRGLLEDLMTVVTSRVTPKDALRHRALAMFVKSGSSQVRPASSSSFTRAPSTNVLLHKGPQPQATRMESCTKMEEGEIPDFGALLNFDCSDDEMDEDTGQCDSDSGSSNDSRDMYEEDVESDSDHE